VGRGLAPGPAPAYHSGVAAHLTHPAHPFPFPPAGRARRRIPGALRGCAALLALCAIAAAGVPGVGRAAGAEPAPAADAAGTDAPAASAAPGALPAVAIFDSAVAALRAEFFDPARLGAHFDSSVVYRRASLAAAGPGANVQGQLQGLLRELGYSGCRFYREGQAPDYTPAFRWRETLDGVVVTAVQPGSSCEHAGLARGDYLMTPRSDLPGVRGTSVTLRVRTSDGVEWSQPVLREGLAANDPDLGWNSYSEHLGYLRVNRLHDPAVVDTAIRHVRRFANLILDVRGCADADPSVLHLLSYFATVPSTAGYVANHAGVAALGRPQVKSVPQDAAENSGDPGLLNPALGQHGLVVLRVQPADSAFQGRVVVLADEGTAGYAELVPAWFRAEKRGSVVGRITAGRGGLPATLRAAPGWTLEVPTAGLFLPDGVLLEGNGVEPTHFVKWRQVDIRAGADPDVERAQQLLYVEP